ncbi:hypothetical protein [Micromonospora endolithica]|uniref:Uncharacterized protein n=1 Tax=Micromonospora endolithica TaxID=230091 RepID=A0A3A9ZJK8_9ACTN|nr:hypothetical protein [Micromonospora endolithica]RKN48531.1 hypothetical protein D7223_11105 [Micromonospora endolithica]TWJ24382.1 hypothetical protein JD76_04532 [Micromonospora endolithica]
MQGTRRRPRWTAAALALLTLTACQAEPAADTAHWSGPGSASSAPPAASTPTRAGTPKVASGFGAAPTDCPEPRPAPRSANSLDPTAASYLGRNADDAANAVDVSPRCEIVVGGRFTGLSGGATTTLGRGGTGAVLRLDGTGRRLLGTTRLAGTVEDLEVRRDGGEIAVATDRGVWLLDATAGTARWQRGRGATRVAVGAAGTVAAVSGPTVTVYDLRGATLATIRPAGRTVSDVAVDDRAGLVFVSGFRQVSAGPCVPVQIAYVHAYDRRGKLRWRAYDHPADRLGDLCADSRADRVAMGRDGKLYLAGQTAGGNTIFARSAADPSRPAPNVVIDKFTQAFNTSNAHYTYLARLDPATGRQLAGQVVISRIDSKGDKGNTIKPYAITADESGRVYAGGVSAYQIADRSRITLGGRRLAAYAGGDAWVLVLSADLRRRTSWVVFTDGGAGAVRGMAAGSGVAAAVAEVDKGPFHRARAVQSTAGGGYVAAWPGIG